jgi:hypothetical protein
MLLDTVHQDVLEKTLRAVPEPIKLIDESEGKILFLMGKWCLEEGDDS